MRFRCRRCSNLADIQAARLATAANGAYDPKCEFDLDTPAVRSVGAFAGAVCRGVAVGLAGAIATWRAGSAAAEPAHGGD
jgi:hypothetical protein